MRTPRSSTSRDSLFKHLKRPLPKDSRRFAWETHGCMDGVHCCPHAVSYILALPHVVIHFHISKAQEKQEHEAQAIAHKHKDSHSDPAPAHHNLWCHFCISWSKICQLSKGDTDLKRKLYVS